MTERLVQIFKGEIEHIDNIELERTFTQEERFYLISLVKADMDTQRRKSI